MTCAIISNTTEAVEMEQAAFQTQKHKKNPVVPKDPNMIKSLLKTDTISAKTTHCFLSADVSAGSPMKIHIKVIARATGILAYQTSIISLKTKYLATAQNI